MTSMKVLSGRMSAAVLCVCAAGLLIAGFAAAAEPSSMSEAKAMGDPAASAPVVPSAALHVYKGEEITEATAVELDLACVQTPRQWTCKDSRSEFEGAARASRAKAKRGGATASASCNLPELILYEHKMYGGWSAAVYQYRYWFDFGAARNNATSSYRTGTASAHLSDFSGGGGHWYPGWTGYCAYHSNILQPYPEWNDRISSRYRY